MKNKTLALIVAGLLILGGLYFYAKQEYFVGNDIKKSVSIVESKNAEHFYDVNNIDSPIGSFLSDNEKYVCTDYKVRELQDIVATDRIR